MKKNLAVDVIVLILGTALVPNITANSDTLSPDKSAQMKITTEVCGIQNEKSYTANVTENQVIALEDLIKDMKNRLDTVKTREETITIFTNTIISLKTLGLLPESMDLGEIRQIVIGDYREFAANKRMERLTCAPLGGFNENENSFCLIAGKTDNTFFIPFVLSPLFFNEGLFEFLEKILNRFALTDPLMELILTYCNLKPISLGCEINVGGFGLPGGPIPSNGWINTIGLTGIKSWNGSFYGGLRSSSPVFFRGVTGFTGVKIFIPNVGDFFYLGSARHVKITSG